MTKSLVRNGDLEKPLILYNRTLSRAIDHSRKIGHSIVVETIDDAVKSSDIVWSCLTDDNAVKHVFDIISQLDIRGKLFVECSSISQDTVTSISQEIIQRGGEFVAMPGKSPFSVITLFASIQIYSFSIWRR